MWRRKFRKSTVRTIAVLPSSQAHSRSWQQSCFTADPDLACQIRKLIFARNRSMMSIEKCFVEEM